MALPALEDFLLVGGTNLSLQYGHRLSDDLDLFSINDFDNAGLIPVLEKEFKDFTYRNPNNPIGIFGFIDNVKVDLVKHQFPLIDKSKTIDEIL